MHMIDHMETIIPAFTKGDRLRKARETAGVTIEEMASLLDVSDRTVRNYENDATPIKRPAVVAWSMRTGAPIEWIIEGVATDTAPITDRYPSDRWESAVSSLQEWLKNTWTPRQSAAA